MKVTKANGKREELDISKIFRWVLWAVKSTDKVFAEVSLTQEIIDEAKLNFYDGIKTEDIQNALVTACEKLAILELGAASGSTQVKGGQLVAQQVNFLRVENLFEIGRKLYLPIVRKRMQQLGISTVEQALDFGIQEGVYDRDLQGVKPYLPAESLTAFEVDDNVPLCGLKQLMTKYFTKVEYGFDKVYNETPTVMYALMATASQMGAKDSEGNSVASKADSTLIFNALSQGKINTPTPMAIGLRTPFREYASCVLGEIPDTMPGIDEGYDLVSKATSARAGLGLACGAIRPLLAPVKNGSLEHTGVIKFLQAWIRITKATVQNSARGGSLTANIPTWHRDFDDLVMLKSPDGDANNRCIEADYCFHYTAGLLQLAMEDKYAALIDPNTVIDLQSSHLKQLCADKGFVIRPGYINPTNKVSSLTAYELYYADPKLFDIWYIDYSNPSFAEGEGLGRAELPLLENARPAENCKVKAYYILAKIIEQLFKTGRIYTFNCTNVQEHTPFLEPIKMTNLCVTGETKILTRMGNIPIKDLVDCEVEVWNGFEWSNVVVKKTGIYQELVKVSLSSGQELVCTPYHNFYTIPFGQQNATRLFGKEKKHTVKEARHLLVGDKLMKHELPKAQKGKVSLPFAYDNGFYTGDGCKVDGKQKIYLYGQKQELKSQILSILEWHKDTSQNRSYGFTDKLEQKFYVPKDNVLLEDKLNWLAGLMDADGTIARNGSNESLQLCSVEREFLIELQLFLQYIGISSKISLNREAGFYDLPDGKGGLAKYDCKAVYRILISSSGLHKLKELGFTTYRLVWNGNRPQRNAEQFITITKVERLAYKADTYCFTEHKRGLGMFNGILTGQCVEVLQPTQAIEPNDPFSEVSLCTLGGIPWGKVAIEELPDVCRAQLLLLDNVLNLSHSRIPYTSNAIKRRNVGVGAIDVHHYLAKKGIRLDDNSSDNLHRIGKSVHEYMEAVQFNLILASTQLAKERGICEDYYKTKWAKGWMPIDTYKQHKFNTYPLKLDWEWLRKQVALYGMRFSCLSAHMPSESSSQIWGFVNGMEPPKDPITNKSSKVLSMYVPVPEIGTLFDKYTYGFDIHNDCYLIVAANIQKFSCQSISYNTYFDYSKKAYWPEDEVMETVFYKPNMMGIKTTYYANFNVDNEGDRVVIKQEEACVGGGCTI